MKNILLAAIVMFVYTTMVWAQEHPSAYDWPKLTPYTNEQPNGRKDTGNYSREEMRNWGLLQPIRFFSVDRFSHKYPALSPYHYGANNPVIFVDVNGDSLEIVGDEKQRQLALEAIRQGLPAEVRDAVQLMEINGKFFVSDIILNDAKGLTKSQEFLALRQIVNSPGMAQLQLADNNLQFQYFDKSIGQSVTTSFGQLGEAFQGITFTTDIANTIYDRTNIVSNVPGVNQSFVRSSMSMENIVQLTAHELYGHVHPQLMGQRASHYRVGDSFDQKIEQIMQRALQNYWRR